MDEHFFGLFKERGKQVGKNILGLDQYVLCVTVVGVCGLKEDPHMSLNSKIDVGCFCCTHSYSQMQMHMCAHFSTLLVDEQCYKNADCMDCSE